MSNQYPQFPHSGNREPVRMPTEPPLQPPTEPPAQPPIQPPMQPPTLPTDGPRYGQSGGGMSTPPPIPPTGGNGAGGFGRPADEPSSPSNTGRTLALIALIVIVVGATIGFAAVGLNASRSTTGPMTMSILECSLSESGDTRVAVTLSDTSGDSNEVAVKVVIVDLDTGEEIDTADDEVQVPAKASQRWEYSGAAGDEVQQITCNVTAEPRN